MKFVKIVFCALFLATLQSCISAGINSEITTNKSELSLVTEKSSSKNVKNKFFPQLSGIDLQGKERALPESLSGKLNLVVVAFKHKQQKDVNTWIPTLETITKTNSAVKFYELPVINESNILKRTAINNGMRSGIKSEEARARTIVVYTNHDKFFAATKLDPQQIYLLALDKTGKILLKIEGVASEEKIKNLKKFIAKLN